MNSIIPIIRKKIKGIEILIEGVDSDWEEIKYCAQKIILLELLMELQEEENQ